MFVVSLGMKNKNIITVIASFLSFPLIHSIESDYDSIVCFFSFLWTGDMTSTVRLYAIYAEMTVNGLTAVHKGSKDQNRTGKIDHVMTEGIV
jgi:hypothetical protein